MPQSLSLVLVHIIFSTKDRRPVLTEKILPDLHAYLATVARNTGCVCFRVGGVQDHVHVAVHLDRSVAVAKLVETLKTSSSKWLKTQGLKTFAWQRGYAVFSVGPTDRDALLQYIDHQAEHHKRRTFQDEFRAFLVKYGVPFDEAYMWD